MKYISIVLIAMAMPCHAAIIPAASCSSGDVTAAIEASSNGDTVSVPAGACTWNTQVSLGAKSITLEGAGAGKTIITNNYANYYGQMLVANAGKSNTTRITGFTFQGTPSRTIGIFCDDTTKPFRIDHNDFMADAAAVFILNYGLCAGLIDRNYLSAPYNSEMVQIHGGGHMNRAGWSVDVVPGSPSAVYVEANQFINSGFSYDANCPCWRFSASSALQSYDGARTVVRYNILQDTQLDQHGNAGYVSARWWEFYENIFHLSQPRTDQDKLMDMRGGSGVIFNNHKTGYWNTRNTIPPIVFREEDEGDPAMDQIGRGKNQALDPAYVWGNDAAIPLDVRNETIIENRDYYLSEKPGYTPYVYPHPLSTTGESPKTCRIPLEF